MGCEASLHHPSKPWPATKIELNLLLDSRRRIGPLFLLLGICVWALGFSMALVRFEPKDVIGACFLLAFFIAVLIKPLIGLMALLGLMGLWHLVRFLMPVMERPFLPLAALTICAVVIDRLRSGTLRLGFGPGWLLIGAYTVLVVWSSTYAPDAHLYHDYFWRWVVCIIVFGLYMHQNEDSRIFRYCA